MLVIVPDDAPPERPESHLAYRALRGIGTAADVLILNRSSFESRLHVVASLPAAVARGGRLLYRGGCGEEEEGWATGSSLLPLTAASGIDRTRRRSG
jgi:hypothetical protein